MRLQAFLALGLLHYAFPFKGKLFTRELVFKDLILFLASKKDANTKIQGYIAISSFLGEKK